MTKKSTTAALVDQVVATPVPAPVATPVQYEVTKKGRDFFPKKNGPVNLKDAATWTTLRDHVLSQDSNSATLPELLSLVPEHKSYVGYAVRRGWLAPVAA